MNSRRVLIAGAAALGVYVAVAVATLGLSGGRLLPLFEGVGPPPPYQWVKPPSAFAAGNTKPKPGSVDIDFNAGKSQGASVTPDGQFSVDFGDGAFSPHGSDTAVRVAVTPFDPATLGPVPSGLAADGNAYRVQLRYQPSATPLDTLTVPGNVFATAPIPGQVLLYSSDGRSWSKLATQMVSATSSVGATFDRPGWYLVAANPTAVIAAGNGNRLGTAALAGLVAGLAILLVAAPIGLRAMRRRSGRRDKRDPPSKPPRATPSQRRQRR